MVLTGDCPIEVCGEARTVAGLRRCIGTIGLLWGGHLSRVGRTDSTPSRDLQRTIPLTGLNVCQVGEPTYPYSQRETWLTRRVAED